MPEIVELSQWLKNQPQTFTTKKRMMVFTDLIYTPTNEKVVTGFRYFRNPITDVVAAFDADDLEAIAALEFALDEDGDADTSAVCLLLAYTKSGSYLAAQPQEYQDYMPTVVREPKAFATPRARALAEALDQSA
ncbi:hypothetical protein [Cellulomonas sp. S1-8]|uniref:hypothetical protein n=1 Tax=Cellulomonas sp. S1-8 TaxID=2904790 RepID=UPI002243DE1A|nr:hypothetical protein [Cellulomonas sp. S1-8]UZN02750.1 hypothetical protein OKX07_17090 [Cellulomonas sp. S1-8]